MWPASTSWHPNVQKPKDLYVSSVHVIAFCVDPSITRNRKRHWTAIHGSGYNILPYFCYNPSACSASALCMLRHYSYCMAAQFMDMCAPASLYLSTGPRRTENGCRSARGGLRYAVLYRKRPSAVREPRQTRPNSLLMKVPSNQTHLCSLFIQKTHCEDTTKGVPQQVQPRTGSDFCYKDIGEAICSFECLR